MYNFFLIYKVFHIFVVIFLRKIIKKAMKFFIILSLILSATTLSFAQNSVENEKKAELYHKEYKFEQALDIYNKVLAKATDSTARIELEKKIIQSENGKNLLDFAFEPNVVAKKAFARKDFFLHYPGFADGSWILSPQNLLQDAQEGEFPVMQYPQTGNRLYFSAPDNSGSWNIHYTEKINDTLWSAPSTLNENITSAGNELFPIVSPNGKYLYFSSNGHYGVGGYDLYQCEWDDEASDWGLPQNMGFPYSSPADDLLFYNTPDGLYSIFASDRGCSRDSLILYVVEFESVPLKKSLTPEQAQRIARLEITGKGGAVAGGTEETQIMESISGDDNSRYAKAVEKVRQLQQQVEEAIAKESASRELYNTLKNPDDLKALEVAIAKQEMQTLTLQNEVNEAVRELQSIELDFLSKGIFVPEVNLEQGKENSDNSAPKHTFAFADFKMGATPKLNVEIPEPEIDLSFRILDTAQLVDISEFPDGLVFQIQLFTLSRKATIKSLKGLSPVFERKTQSGKYTYSVGIFDNYKSALANLNKVRKRGFSSAAITAYNDGKYMNVTKARALEKEIAESAVYQVVIEGYTESLPKEVLTVIRTSCEKDIAKVAEAGTTKYVIGPFGKQADANTLATAIRAVSDKSINVEKVD